MTRVKICSVIQKNQTIKINAKVNYEETCYDHHTALNSRCSIDKKESVGSKEHITETKISHLALSSLFIRIAVECKANKRTKELRQLDPHPAPAPKGKTDNYN